jgi:sugar O-acyltransferase (sialic acid O-acetyltransferase NeuD family)
MTLPNLPICVIGAGGHAKVVIAALRAGGADIACAVDTGRPDPADILGVPVIGEQAFLETYLPDAVNIVLGVGSTAGGSSRQEIFDRFAASDFRFATLVHPGAIVDGSAAFGSGCQVMAGAVLQVGVALEDNVIVNTGAVIDHDCVIGAHVHVAPGAVIAGDVHVEAGAHVGCGATIRQGIRIGAGSTVGAGAVVVKDVLAGTMVVGVPAVAAGFLPAERGALS